MSEKLAPYRVISVSKKGERPFPIKNPYKSFSFGTDPTCQIRLKDVKDASFAAVHCQVTPIEGKMFLVSHAHTLVNGQPTKGVPVALNNGDMISIGKGAVHVNFRFETVTVDKPVESVPFKDITQQVVVPDTPIKVEKSTDGNLAHSSSSLFETHNGSQDRSRHEDEDSAEDKENNPSGVAKERRATAESDRPEADREEAPKSDVVPKSTPAKPLQRKLTYSDAMVPPPQEKKASKKASSSSSSLAVDTELKNYEEDEAQVVSLSSALQEVEEEPVEEKKATKTPKKQTKTPKKNTKAKKTEEKEESEAESKAEEEEPVKETKAKTPKKNTKSKKAEEKPVEVDESEDNEVAEEQPAKGKKKAAKIPKKNAKAKKAEEKPVEESEASEAESKAEEAEPVKETKKKGTKTPKKNAKAKKANKKDESESEKAAEESEDVSEAEAKPEKKTAKTPKKNSKAKKDIKKEESEPEKESEAEEESAETKKTPKKAASKSKKQTKTVERRESEKEESEAEQSEQEKPEPEFKTPTKKSSKTPSKAYVAKATYDSPKTSPTKSPRPLNISPSKRYQKITHISGSVQHEVYSRWVPQGFDITKDTKQPRQLRNSPERKNTNFLAQKVYPGTAVKSAKKSKKNKKQASAPNSPTKTVKTPAKSKSKSKKEKEIKIKVDTHKSKSYGRPVEHFDAPDERSRMDILSMSMVNMIKEQLALMNTWVSFEEIYTYHRAHYAVLNMDALRDIVKELVNEKIVSLSTKSKTKRYCLAGCEPEEPVKEKKAKVAEELPENETDDEESEDEGDLRTDLQQQMMQIWLLVKAAKSDKFPQAVLPFMHRPSKTKYPEYYASVSRVVTMKMILQNIKAGDVYETLEDMAKDFRQMFVNFKRFNRPTSDVYRCGALLEKAYKAAMKEAKEAANEKPEEEEGSEHESEEKSESEEREQSSERESEDEDEEEKSERDEESENGSDNEEEKSGSDNEEEASAEESVKESVESDDE